MNALHRCVWMLAALVAGLLWAASANADDEAGKAAFTEYKCNKCHAVESKGIELLAVEEEEEDLEDEEAVEPPDLSNTGATFESAGDIQKWLMKKLELEGRKHKSRFRGDKGDLELLSEWLLTLKTEG